nr:energy transducer TonB [Treponema sp.]
SLILFLCLACFFIPVNQKESLECQNTLAGKQSTVSFIKVAKRVAPKQTSEPEKKTEKKLEKKKEAIKKAPEKTAIAAPNAVIEEKKEEEIIEPTPATEEARNDSNTENSFIENGGENSNKNIENASSTIISNAKEYSSFKAYALKRIASKKIYPMAARAKNQEDNIKVKVVIGKDGKLKESKILNESKYSSLNEASLKAVQKAAPFKSLPDGIDEMELIFVMEFKLTS